MRNATLLIGCLFIRKAQQQREARCESESKYVHSYTSHKYSHNNCTSLYTINGTLELLLYICNQATMFFINGKKGHFIILKHQNNPKLNFRNPNHKSGILIFLPK